MADFDKAFENTGAGAGQDQKSEADLKKERQDSLKDLTEVFSKKNLFGKEKPNEEATQKAVLEQTVELQKALVEQLSSQKSTEQAAASIFQTIEVREQKQSKVDQDAAEDAFESKQLIKDQNKKQDELLEVTGAGTEAQEEQAVQGAKRGSMIGKLGMAMAGAGIAAAGIGVALFASAKAMKEFDDVDGKAVASNIKEIMSIVPKADGEGALLSFLAEGGTLALALYGLGIGLGVFGVGSAAAGAAEKFAGFDAQSIKDNVGILLSIDEDAGGKGNLIGDSAVFLLAMTGIGAGLAIFGLGSAAAGAGQGVAEGISRFSDNKNFAQNIKDNVLTLLSIDDAAGGKANLIGDSATFLLAMTGIGAGLAIFGAGTAVAGIGQGLAEGINHFSSDKSFADTIKHNVLTLLSIDDELAAKGESFIGDSAEFLLAMGGIGAGLAVFGAGSAAGALGAGLANFMSKEGDFSKDIKDKVNTLLSIGDDRSDLVGDAENLRDAMIKIGDGVAKFGSKSLENAFSNFVGGILDFFTGGDSPIEIAMKVADKGDDLKKGAEGMSILADSFKTFGRLDMSDMKIDSDFIDSLEDFTDKVNDMFGHEAYDGFLFDREAKESEFTGIIAATEIFNSFADSMERVTDAGINLQGPNVGGLQLNIASSGMANSGGVTVIQNTSSPTSITSSSAVISNNLTDSTSTSITETN